VRPRWLILSASMFLPATVGLSQVGVTDAPKGVVVNAHTGKAYVAFPDLGIVKIVAADDGTTILPTGPNVKSLTLDPRSGRVYAMNRGPGTISVIDPVTNGIIATLTADRGSLTALNPATGRLYVSASTGTNPSVIDLATGKTTGIDAGTEGNALSVDVAANKVYFVGYEDNFLTIIDGRTNQRERLTLPGFHQWESGLDRRRHILYLPSPNDDAVAVVDTVSRHVATIGVGYAPVAVAVNETTGSAYIVNYGSSDVSVLEANAAMPIATIKVGLWPQQIAVDQASNRIFVVNTHADSVSIIDGRTNRVTATVRTARGPWAIAVNPGNGKAYVASRLTDRVTIIDGAKGTAIER
jgi:YVTN family beta-propeller protein